MKHVDDRESFVSRKSFCDITQSLPNFPDQLRFRVLSVAAKMSQESGDYFHVNAKYNDLLESNSHTTLPSASMQAR